MAPMPKPPKRPRDPIQLAKAIGDIATGQRKESSASLRAIIGQRGGLQGGKIRMDALTPQERKELAQHAAAARWKKTAPVAKTGAAKVKPKSVKQR